MEVDGFKPDGDGRMSLVSAISGDKKRSSREVRTNNTSLSTNPV